MVPVCIDSSVRDCSMSHGVVVSGSLGKSTRYDLRESTATLSEERSPQRWTKIGSLSLIAAEIPS